PAAQKPAARVQAALDALGLDIQIRAFAVPTSTADEAAEAIGCALGAIVKSLCFLVDERPVLVLAAGDRRVDPKALRRIYGVSKRKVKIADPETVQRLTGYAVGGVPPLGHSQPMQTLIDRSLSRYETVYAAAGTSNTIFPIAYRTLVEVTQGEVEDLT
ncbi:MAG: YbaK/EbsC family protein, partial [Anaerolineae bacterium]|nr:YbaK/EbsC family protein [Anaerolineae bacterium]